MTPPLMKVEQSALVDVWGALVDRIAAVAEGQPWNALHAGQAILSGAAELWVTASLSGFVIVTVISEPWQKQLFVWVACNEIEANAAAYLPQIKQIAKRHGCEVVQFFSKRKGFRRVIPDADVSFVYSIGVE